MFELLRIIQTHITIRDSAFSIIRVKNKRFKTLDEVFKGVSHDFVSDAGCKRINEINNDVTDRLFVECMFMDV